MPTKRILKPLAALVAVTGLLALPAAAQATLTFVKNPRSPAVYTAADNGSGVHKVGPGNSPHMAPDGESVAYFHEAPGHGTELKLAPVRGGATRTLMVGWREPFYLAFSPDSTTIAALRGAELGKRKLVLIDIASGAQRVLASGYFSGFSFSPESGELAYSKANSESYPPRSDVYRVPIAGGKPVALTHDHASEDPLWGPGGKIVFVKLLDANKRKYGPKNELYLMNPQGKGVKRLTHTNVDPLLQGLFPTAWSDSGNQLLAEFEGQDTSYAVKVNPKTGAQKPVVKAEEMGFVGTALSGDGKTILGYEGGFDPGNQHSVVTIPYTGGKPKVLIKGATEPDWSL
jgi:dipeptidyl aminopeptidase/acylaminoacyl peptidase